MAVAPAEDALSPTTIILNRLKAQGVPITPDNIRRAVTELGRLGGQDPTETSPGGLSLGEVEDSSPAPQRRSNRPAPGRGRPSPPPVTGGDRRGPAVGATPPMDRREGAGSPTTSAPAPGTVDPTDPNAGNELDLSSLIAPAIGAGGLYAASRFARPGSGQTFMGNQPMPPTGRVMDLNPTAIPGGAHPAIEGPQIALPGPASASGGVPPVATDMEAAMQRAMQPAGAPTLSSGGAPDLSGVRPFVQPADVIGAGQPLPPGISDADAARAAIGPGGMTQDRVAGQVGVPEVPLASNPAIRGQPMPEIPGRSGFFNALLDALSSAGNVASRAVRR